MLHLRAEPIGQRNAFLQSPNIIIFIELDDYITLGDSDVDVSRCDGLL